MSPSSTTPSLVYKMAANQGGSGDHFVNASDMVDAAAHGRGVGRALVEHSLGAARDAGFEAMVFNAVAETNVHAIAR